MAVGIISYRHIVVERKYEIISRLIIMQGLKMNIFDEVKTEEIDNWLQQFEISEQGYINKLLNNFIYYNSNMVREVVKTLHNKIINRFMKDVGDIWYVPVGYVTKSGSVIAYYYRSVNELEEEKFISSNDIDRILDKSNIGVVFIDDYIGTGHQAKQVWDFVIHPIINKFSESKFFYCTLAGMEEGIKYVRDNTKFEVLVDKVICAEELPFTDKSKIFENSVERKKAEEIVRKYGEILYPGNALGYKNSQALVGFFYSTPNNTLPIFWSTNEKWHPLLPRNESFRDPKNLIGKIAGLSNSVANIERDKLASDLSELEKFDATEEFVTKGISEFQKLPNILALIQPMKKLGVSDEIFSCLVNLIGKLKRNLHEKEAVKANILLVKQEQNLNVIGDFYIKVDDVKITDTDKIISLVGMIYDYNNTLVIDNNGKVWGLLSLYDKGSVNLYLPNQFKRVLFASRKTEGLAILCNGDGRVSIISEGQRILLHRGASWFLSSWNHDATVQALSRKYKIRVTVLEKIFSTIFEMAYIGKGGLVTIGDSEEVKKYSEQPAIDFVQNLKLNVEKLSVSALVGMIEQDGATIISDKGVLEQSMSFLRPPSDAPGKVEINRGSRHSTALRVSAITQAIVIAVSVDGRITLYKGGEIVFKIMG